MTILFGPYGFYHGQMREKVCFVIAAILQSFSDNSRGFLKPSFDDETKRERETKPRLKVGNKNPLIAALLLIKVTFILRNFMVNHFLG